MLWVSNPFDLRSVSMTSFLQEQQQANLQRFVIVSYKLWSALFQCKNLRWSYVGIPSCHSSSIYLTIALRLILITVSKHYPISCLVPAVLLYIAY